MVKLSQAQLETHYKRAQSLAHKARGALEKADEIVDRGVEAVLTGGAAFGAGVLTGRYGGLEIGGVPGDLGGALLLHGLAFAGVVPEKAAPHIHAVGNGLLAHYASVMGRGVGDTWAQRATGGGAALPSGGAAAGSVLSDRELASHLRA